jgi:hypothetical protein
MPFTAHRWRNHNMWHWASAATSKFLRVPPLGIPAEGRSELPGSIGLPFVRHLVVPAVAAVAGGTLTEVASPGDGPIAMFATHPASLPGDDGMEGAQNRRICARM